MSDRGTRLGDLIFDELRSIPIDSWTFMFPAHVAVAKRLGQIDSSVGPFVARNPPPEFEGPGATWLVDVVMSDEGYLDDVEEIMKAAADQLTLEAFDRGFLLPGDSVTLPEEAVTRLETRLHQFVATRPR